MKDTKSSRSRHRAGRAAGSARSARRRLVPGDRGLQVFVFLALEEQGARLLQRDELLFGLGQLVHVEIELAEVLARAAMARIDLERALVVLHGLVVAAELPVAKAEQALDVGVVRPL